MNVISYNCFLHVSLKKCTHLFAFAKIWENFGYSGRFVHSIYNIYNYSYFPLLKIKVHVGLVPSGSLKLSWELILRVVYWFIYLKRMTFLKLYIFFWCDVTRLYFNGKCTDIRGWVLYTREYVVVTVYLHSHLSFLS